MDLVLDDVCEFINGGAWSEDEYADSGIRVVKVTNMENGTIGDLAGAYLPVAKYEKYKRHELREHDVVVATVGSHPTQPGSVVGRTARIPSSFAGAFLNQNAVCLRVKRPDLVDQRFLFYLSRTILFKHHIESRARGSANQVRMAIGDLRRFTTRFPSISNQKKIAAILATHDDLIETNQRRIALLERMAEEIYREWFVRLRFPGHEKTKIVKGVPQGWRVAELQELATVNPSSLTRRERPETILYVDISSVSTNRIEGAIEFAPDEAPGRARRRVKHGDVIWSSVRPANRAYCLIFEPPENLIVSTGFAVIRPKPDMPFTFLFFAVTSNPFVEQMTNVAKGAAYPATAFDDFERAKILVPTEPLLHDFHDCCEPLFRQRHILQQQSETLARTRDLLLPRLISGKLRVDDLDIQFPPSMAEEPVNGGTGNPRS